MTLPSWPKVPSDTVLAQLDGIVATTRKLMSRDVGVLRSGADLAMALSRLTELDKQMRSLADQDTSCRRPSENDIRRWSEGRNLLLVARLVTLAATQRTESRGAHYRDDYPNPVPEWKRRQFLTVDQLDAAQSARINPTVRY